MGRQMNRSGRAVLAAAVIALAISGVARAVTVSPVALYIDSRTRSALLTLHNNGVRPEEVEIAFAFGYPQSDSAGNLRVELVETPPPGEPAATAWLSAFPRRMVLQPGQRQVVRILAEPPAGTPDGEYWARVLVKSRGGQAPIERQVEEGVAIQLAIETVVAIAASYRQGQLETGVRVERAEAARRGDSIFTTLDVARTGNAAFLGRLQLELLDEQGRVLGATEEHIAIYRTVRRIPVLVAPPGAGALRVRVTLDTRREDLPPEGILPAEPVTAVVPVN